MDTQLFTVEGTVLRPPTGTFQPVETFTRIVRATDEHHARRIARDLASPFYPILINKIYATG